MKTIFFTLPAMLALTSCTSAAEGDVPGDADETQPFDEITEGQVLRLTGTEPFWGGEISAGMMTYTTPQKHRGDALCGHSLRGTGRPVFQRQDGRGAGRRGSDTGHMLGWHERPRVSLHRDTRDW